MVKQVFGQYIPTRIFFGNGEIKRMATEKLPGRKAMIVISSGTSMRKFGYLDKLTQALDSQKIPYVIYDKILPNPIREHVMEAATICREEGCDFIIGLGGGSSIDSAKSIAIMARNDGDYWDYISGGSGKAKPITKGVLPIIAIPTTAGTGTEADQWTVISNGEEKIGFGTDETFPTISIVDPELMVSVPPHLTAYQGFDALFHSVEGYLANIASPLSQMYSLKSIELIASNLTKAVKDGADLESRANVALGSMLAGMVEATSCTISQHALEHAMSGLFPKLPHGAGLIIISEAYLSSFLNDVPERYKEMAQAMTGKRSDDPEDFIRALVQLQKDCGVYGLKFSDWGATEADFPRIVANARETMTMLFYLDPRPLSNPELIGIFEKSFR